MLIKTVRTLTLGNLISPNWMEVDGTIGINPFPDDHRGIAKEVSDQTTVLLTPAKLCDGHLVSHSYLAGVVNINLL